MAGIALDIVVLVAVAAFAMAGASLALVGSLVRLVAAFVAFVLAALLARGGGRVIEAIIPPLGPDVASLLAMLLVGTAAYVAVAKLARHYEGWVPVDRVEGNERLLGAIPGALLGLLWALVMVSLLVLMPSDNLSSRAAVTSTTGRVLLTAGEGWMRFLSGTFPGYTQTLPKGELGAAVTDQESIVLGPDLEVSSVDDDAGTLLENINQLRSSRGVAPLTWNPQIAEVAAEHSRLMFEEEYLATSTPGGGELTDRVRSALGSSAQLFGRYDARVAWAHGPANAYAALVGNRAAANLLGEDDFLEVGIGAVDGGWFNGRMYSIVLIGCRPLPGAVEPELGVDGEAGDPTGNCNEDPSVGTTGGAGSTTPTPTPGIGES